MRIKLIFCVAFVAVLLSCGSDGNNPLSQSDSSSSNLVPSSSSVHQSSSDAAKEYGYCLYPEYSLCLVGSHYDCPSGGILSEYCPFSSSSDMPSSSSDDATINSSESKQSSSSNSSDSSNSSGNSSSSATQEFGYCVFEAEKICLQTTESACPPTAVLSNACPYSSSSSNAPPSSSSIQPSSSSSKPDSSSSLVSSSSSSKPNSSSSLVSSSSSSKPSSSSSLVSSSSSIPPSSSSIVPSSSSVGSVASGGKGNDIANYRTVPIGEQVWMAENLNYAVQGSKCGNGSALSDEDTPTCDTYGRLYSWVTAMSLPSNCSVLDCESQLSTKHRGICPEGWHIPSDADWDKLLRFVDGKTGTSSLYLSPNGGYDLKATSGWNCGYTAIDKYGFSALPGGYSYGNGFNEVGIYGRWWSASQPRNTSNANHRYMSCGNDRVYYEESQKNYLFSVRCVKD